MAKKELDEILDLVRKLVLVKEELQDVYMKTNDQETKSELNKILKELHKLTNEYKE